MVMMFQIVRSFLTEIVPFRHGILRGEHMIGEERHPLPLVVSVAKTDLFANFRLTLSVSTLHGLMEAC